MLRNRAISTPLSFHHCLCVSQSKHTYLERDFQTLVYVSLLSGVSCAPMCLVVPVLLEQTVSASSAISRNPLKAVHRR
ncbi:hypothetical protein BDV39DRAFT_165624 [Aspergillus sergii]|uniref:Uncharacterized protein n=1 Tax=Aspergillus sergii TaxID=1034303 RepID=A0A5N6XK59_9EURO|nr:hypothetical protein BDV39DRAFT_165624 [Aspergillus sergii]